MSEQIDTVLHSAVASGAVPSVVGLVAGENGLVYAGAAGARVAGGSESVTPDTMLRIASMTKTITTVAALQLWERGHLHLEAPVDTYCPQFADLQVLDGFDGDTPRLCPPATRATVKQLITHTAGLGYRFFNENLVRWEHVTGTANILSGKREIFTAPLSTDPGTRFEYGTNIDWLGLVIESASQQPLDEYVRDNILEPLGMSSTTFSPTPEQRAGMVPVHVQAGDGQWQATDIDWSPEPEWWAGGHGLYSTPREYLRFQRMLLRGGELDGRQILQSSTVEAAFTNQIGELDFPPTITSADKSSTCDFNIGPGVEVGARAVAQQRAGARNARSLERRLGRHFQHSLLGRPEQSDHWRDLLAVPAVRHSTGAAAVRRLRAGGVRVSMTRRAATRRRRLPMMTARSAGRLK